MKDQILDSAYSVAAVVLSAINGNLVDVVRVKQPGIPVVNGVRQPNMPNKIETAREMSTATNQRVVIRLGHPTTPRMFMFRTLQR